MSRLHTRIARQPLAAGAAAASFGHPWGTEATPVFMPANLVRYGGGMTGVEQVLWAPDGRPIPRSGGAYGSARRAGRP